MELAEVQAEALKTGDWSEYNKLTLRKIDEEAAPVEALEAEEDKALFLPDFQRLEASLQKKMFDPTLTIEERAKAQDKLTALSLKWAESGIRDIGVILAIRDNTLNILNTAKTLHLLPGDLEIVFAEPIETLRRLNKIIAEANAKGIKTALPEVD